MVVVLEKVKDLFHGLFGVRSLQLLDGCLQDRIGASLFMGPYDLEDAIIWIDEVFSLKAWLGHDFMQFL